MINVSFLEKCISKLELAFNQIQNLSSQSAEYDIYRSAIIKEFEIILEQSGKLLKKCLKPYFHTPKVVDSLYFKDIFRYACSFGLLSLEEVERWLLYRDNRNETSHDYGVEFAEKTLSFMNQFIIDAKMLVVIIKKNNDS